MNNIILVKHSQPHIVKDRPARDWTLSAEGRARCLPLAHALAAFKPDHVVASLEPKAAETGQIVARVLDLPFETLDGLHEHRRDNEPFHSQIDFEMHVKQFFARPTELNFGTETAEAAYHRFAQVVRSVAERGQISVIVAHGTVITLFVARYNALEPFALWKKLDLPSFVVLSRPAFKCVTVQQRVIS